jgi:hypothetical protein
MDSGQGKNIVLLDSNSRPEYRMVKSGEEWWWHVHVYSTLTHQMMQASFSVRVRGRATIIIRHSTAMLCYAMLCYAPQARSLGVIIALCLVESDSSAAQHSTRSERKPTHDVPVAIPAPWLRSTPLNLSIYRS